MRLLVLASLATVTSAACARQPAKETPLASAEPRAATVFTDTALFRARCREADGLRSLAPVPRQCTPRDQRSDPVVLPVPAPVPPKP